MTGNFLIVRNCRLINGLSICGQNGLADGMIGIAFRLSRMEENLLPVEPVGGFNLCHLKHAFCQCAGLVEHNNADLIQCFQIVAALDKDAAFGGCADSAEEGQRNGDHQSAGAGND